MTLSTYESRHIARTIARDAASVYAYASDPRNLPAWAAGLSTTISLVEGEWVAESDLGRITVELAPDNSFGVLDHTVTLPDGTRVHNPLRVVPNGDGCDVVFSLFRLPGVDDAAFEADAAAVAADLETLRTVLEAASAAG
ncbi:SRPBCC family protein [Aeromicrobium chenweiae]|uniref:Polyketide cyclase n=1 Tax=Aeromicrobium chenweiae TaxID=2079793 RepID=A0A2S0WLG2_9ACTN|nr:SRPBCC family protein [Aeromicrobium chenweiae]AWB92173.1 polyketide cyclase [Aeromicrobium chenweiae]TGN33027.1 SRPBCC family protein [Aeromicrobium chenweiae]